MFYRLKQNVDVMKHKNDNLDDIGMVFGYLLMFFVFVTFLYFILNILGKLPESWGYFYILIFF